MEKSAFHIGQFALLPSSNYHGRIEELRIFLDKRTSNEILGFLFEALTLANDNRLVCFDFSTLSNQTTYGAYNNHEEGLLGGGIDTFSPIQIEDRCIKPVVEPESLNWLCNLNGAIINGQQFVPFCFPIGLPPAELLCNGNFEQFCNILYQSNPWWTSGNRSWLLPHHAFAKHSNQNAAKGSDVANWWPIVDANGVNESPDFYVRNGIGSATGFNPMFPNVQWINPPTNTWNGIGDGVSAIGHDEGLQSVLNHSLKPNEQYIFSGWFYKTERIGTVPLAQPGFIRLHFNHSNNGNSYSTPLITIPRHNQSNLSNGWVFFSYTFTTPSNLPSGLNAFSIVSDMNSGDYLFMDNLSLSEQPANFPQYVNSGDLNDLHHRRIKTDANDNVYVLISMESVGNGTVTGSFGAPPYSTFTTNESMGSIVVKYDSDGLFQWRKFFENVNLVDLDFDSNNNLHLVGYTQSGEEWNQPHITYTTSNPQVLARTCYNGQTQDAFFARETEQLYYLKLSELDGSVLLQEARGGTGQERGMGIYIYNDVVHLIVEIYPTTLCFTTTPPPNPIAPIHNTGLDWFGGNSFNSCIVRYNAISGSKIPNVSGYIPNEPQLVKGSGNKLFVLRRDGILDKLTKNTSLNTYSISSVSIDLDATYMHPSYDQNNIFVTYKNPNKVEVRSYSTLALISSIATTGRPVSIGSGQSGDYILYRQSSNGNVSIPVLGIEKINPSNLNTILWQTQTSSQTASIMNQFQSRGFEVPHDLVCYKSSTNEMTLVGSFETTSNQWVFSNGTRSINGSNIGYGNCVILKATDLGSHGQFKWSNDFTSYLTDTNDTIEDEVLIYPNPSKGSTNIKSNNKIREIEVYSLNGTLVFRRLFDSLNSLTISTNSIPKGVCFIIVKTDKNVFRKMLLVE